MKVRSKILMKYAALLLTISYLHSCNTSEQRANKADTKVKEAAKVHTVVIQQMKFTPAEVSVNEGDTVIWINRDIVEHNITEEVSKKWSSGNLPAGKSWNMVATEHFTYFCSIHPVMKGSVKVR